MQTKSFKHLDLIIGLFVAVLLVSNIASSAKLVSIGRLEFDAGTLIFPLSYIFDDVLTEVYGYKTSRRVIWIGFVCLFLMSAILMIVGVLPGTEFWRTTNAAGDPVAGIANYGQDAFDKILGLTGRIVAGSLLAFFVGSFSNDFILAKLKIMTSGKLLWLRTIGSTLVGEGLDTMVFALVAFLGVLPQADLVTLIISNYVFKVGVEVVFTPITYAVVNFLKRSESVDTYDRDTDFNPFKIEA